MGTRFEYHRVVNHRCGHSERHTLMSHNRQEADTWAHNLRNGDCTSCRDMARENDKNKINMNLLPELIGNHFQVRKATLIRFRVFSALSSMNMFKDKAYLCRNETRAEWWIEHGQDRLKVIVSHLIDTEIKAA